MNLPKFGSSSSSKGGGALSIIWIVLFGVFVVVMVLQGPVSRLLHGLVS